jgi:DNA-binding GntR family transcriptional regulator
MEGEHLSETQLAERFGVSRGPIREALVQLTNEGLLVAKRNCGVKVASSAPDFIQELVIPLRRTLETFALRLFFHQLNADDFRWWEKCLDRMKHACQQGDIASAVEEDIGFHRFLLDQPDLLAIWSTIVARIRRHFWQVHRSRKKRPIDVYADHRALLDAFQTGDVEAAVQALHDHIL